MVFKVPSGSSYVQGFEAKPATEKGASLKSPIAWAKYILGMPEPPCKVSSELTKFQDIELRDHFLKL